MITKGGQNKRQDLEKKKKDLTFSAFLHLSSPDRKSGSKGPGQGASGQALASSFHL